MPIIEKPDEIEITGSMIEAAAVALASYDDRFCSLEDAAERIVRAALEARENG